MIQLVDLPNRRTEAWRYTDLRAAMGEQVQFVLKQDRKAPAVVDATTRGGVIAALAEQMGGCTQLSVACDEHVVRVDRPTYANLEPRFLDISIAPGGQLTRVVLQSDIDGVVLDGARVRVEEGGVFQQFILSEGARLARLETHVEVAGANARVELNGVYIISGGRHADLTSIVGHKAVAGETRQLTKGVVRKGGRGVFQGKIVVERDARKTDARQYHHGILLEEGAELFAKPELMIHADDVACAHGNTAGSLDEQALFYLRSRGVPEMEARALLTEAFLLEAVPEWLPADVRDEVEARIAAWLRRAS